MAVDPLQAIRDIALAFPEATEKEAWGHPTFRVRDKIFVTFGESDGVAQVTMKAAPGAQAALLAEGPPFFHPKYVGSKGWIGVVVDEHTDWVEIAELVTDSYCEIAPTTLARTIGVTEQPASVRAMRAAMTTLGEIIEGRPPKDVPVAEADASGDDSDGLRVSFDPEDPGSTTIEV